MSSTRKTGKTTQSAEKPPDSRYISDACIPQELIEKVINYLGDNKRGLKKCALVSRIFLVPCQKLLFEHVTLGPTVRGLPLEILKKIITASPHLTSYIMSLRLEDDSSLGRAGLPCWLASTTMLPKTMSKLRNLKQLHIFADRIPIQWNDLPSATKASFNAIISCGRLHTLALASVSNFPLELISPGLKVLDLFDIVPTLPASLDQARPPVQLYDLRVQYHRGYSPDWLGDLLQANSPLCLKELRKLTFVFDVETLESAFHNFDVLNNAINNVAASLTELSLDPNLFSRFGRAPEFKVEHFMKLPFQPLENLPSLQKLHLSLNIGGYDNRGQIWSLLWCTYMLAMVDQSRLPSLTMLHVKCDYFRLEDPDKEFEPYYWHNVDAALSSSNLDFIPSVYITIYVCAHTQNRLEERSDLVRKELVGVAQKHDLQVEAVYDEDILERMRRFY